MRHVLSTLLAATVLFAVSGLCRAQDEPKPLVTISFASYDKLLADIGMIGNLGGNAALSKQLEAKLLDLPKAENAESPLGLDKKRPAGAVLLSGSPAPTAYVFVPVSDIKPLMELAKTQPSLTVTSEKDVYQISASGKTIYAMQKGKWAVLADSQELLDKAPTDPSEQLGDLPKRYDVAVLVAVQNLPKEYRDQLMAYVHAGAAVGMQQLPNETEEQHALRTAGAAQSIEQLTMFVNDLDNLLIGWNVDSKTKSTYLDVEITAKPDTKLAKQMALVKPGPSKFAALVQPGATVTLNSLRTLSDDDVAQAKVMLGNLRQAMLKGLEGQGLSADDAKLTSSLLDDVLDVLQKSIETKKGDSALSVILEPAATTLVAGGTIAEGAKLKKDLQQLVERVKKDEDAAKRVTIKTETHQGVSMFVVSMPASDEKLAKIVGDTAEVAVGVDNDRLLIAAGRDAAQSLKDGIDRIKKAGAVEALPLQIVVATKPIAKFVAEVSEDQQAAGMAMMLAGLLDQAGDKDHLTLTAKPIAKGISVRLELEEGILKAVGMLTTMASGLSSGNPPQ